MKAISKLETLTMSSLEIADLVEKRHDNVKRTIDKLASKGVIGQPQIEDGLFIDSQGKERTRSLYNLNKRDTLVVVAQLSPEFTARVIDRWQELESQVAKGKSKSWHKVRLQGKSARNWFTDALRENGCSKPHHYMNCTKAISKAATGKTPAEIKRERGVTNSRDGLTIPELAKTTMIEVMAEEAIRKTNSVGFDSCYQHTKLASQAVKVALEAHKTALASIGGAA